MSYWYSWALLTPAILWLSRRFPLERRAFAAHRCRCTSSAWCSPPVVHVLLAVSSTYAIRSVHGDVLRWSWQTELQRMFFLNFDWEMMTYWAIVGVSHALRYQHEAQDRALRASQLETRLVEAQLQTLQRQLQPHFLFNTLNTISALMHRDVEAADEMIARLSDLLRMSLDMVGMQEVSLKEELDFLQKYVEIEQTRFHDRLSVVFEVQPGTLDALVPNLLLQPLVENAIKHGIGPRSGPGHVADARGAARPRAGAGRARQRRRHVGVAAVRLQPRRGAVEHPVAARAPLRRRCTGSSSAVRRRRALGT